MTRGHFLRGYGAPRETSPMIYAEEPHEPRSGRFSDETNWWSTKLEDEAPGCSVCRDSELHCLTPDSCHLPTAEQIQEAEDVKSLHRLSWPLCMLVIVLALAASAVWPMGFAG